MSRLPNVDGDAPARDDCCRRCIFTRDTRKPTARTDARTLPVAAGGAMSLRSPCFELERDLLPTTTRDLAVEAAGLHWGSHPDVPLHHPVLGQNPPVLGHGLRSFENEYASVISDSYPSTVS